MYNATDEQLRRLLELVNEKTEKEVKLIGIKNVPFDSDRFNTHLLNHGLREVEKYNNSPKKVTFDAWMRKALNGDFLNFIGVKKNQMTNIDSLDAKFEEWGDNYISFEESNNLQLEDSYLQGDWEEMVLEDWEADSLEEVKEELESMNLSLLSQKTRDEMELFYTELCKKI